MSKTSKQAMTAMSPSVNNIAPAFVVLGNPGSRRLLLFQEALSELGLKPTLEIAWADFLAGRLNLSHRIPPNACFRIESPGKDFPVEQAILELGANHPESEETASVEEIRALTFDKGRILYPRQWFLGFREALRRVEAQLAAARPHSRMNACADILTMFDKNACHASLQAAGVAVPRTLNPETTPGEASERLSIRSYEELRERMKAAAISRVFIKLAHGSSASGVVAYRTNGREHQAITTVEMVEANGKLEIYNSRRLLRYRNENEIERLIDALCRHRVHVEEWIPKASFAGHIFDLRVVVIAGQAQQVVVRQSDTPMTNLHLLNTRGDWNALQTHIGETAWSDARQACEAAMRCFPDSLYAGIDLMFASGFRRHAILEVNAFGDLLPGILHNGRNAYAAEIAAVLRAANIPLSGCEYAAQEAEGKQE